VAPGVWDGSVARGLAISAAIKPHRKEAFIAAVNRCATQKRFQQTARASTELDLRQPLADKAPALTNSVQSHQQFACGMFFNHIAQCPQPESFLRHEGGCFLTQEEYFGLRQKAADSAGDFNSI